MNLQGVALITGAGGAIGRACVKQFVKDGCRRIVGLDSSGDGLKETASQLSSDFSNHTEFVPIPTNLTVESEVRNAFEKVKQRFGRIDYAVNNAGVSQKTQTTPESSLDEFEKVMSVNLKGVWLCAREELRIMKSQPLRAAQTNDGRQISRGSIINISSICGHLVMPGLSLYIMSKFGAVGLTKADALDFARHGVRVNTIMPGFVETPLLTPIIKAALQPCIDKTPLGRMAYPHEIADSATFLASDRASYITGSSLVVDGGYTIH